MSILRLTRTGTIESSAISRNFFNKFSQQNSTTSSSPISNQLKSISTSSFLSQSPSLFSSNQYSSNFNLSRNFSSGRGFDPYERYMRRTAINWGIRFVPQQEAYVIERFGKFNSVLEAGLHLLIPFVDRIAYIHSLKEQTIEIPEQPAVTTDNVSIRVNGVLFVKVIDAKQASYGNDNVLYAVTQLAQTVMRSAIGKMPLDRTFMERDTINANIVKQLLSLDQTYEESLKLLRETNAAVEIRKHSNSSMDFTPIDVVLVRSAIDHARRSSPVAGEEAVAVAVLLQMAEALQTNIKAAIKEMPICFIVSCPWLI